MDHKRYVEIERRLAELTLEEWKAGWHFCAEWDYMLVGPDMPEWEACLCTVKREQEGAGDEH